MSAYDPTQPSQLQPNSVLNVCEGFDCTSNDQVPRSLCLSCGSTYCDNCWDKQGPHRPGKVGVDGLPHEKTKKPIYDRLKTIFEPPEDSNELSRLHIEDEDTTWFGVEKDSGGRPMFQDYGRYAALMAETKQPSSGVRYPQLVSFIGQTGAGKSTLIKMLVSLKEQKLQLNLASPFRSPVVGSVKNDKSPTSGDVHLYIDPDTAYGPLPLLYADCEGLEGGEIAPRATQLRETMRDRVQPTHLPRRLFGTRPRELTIAQTNAEAANREWAVRKVYPRLLYTFSDVVVFVLRNTRAFESSALKLLIEWASTSVEFSVNQPTLPHAIIVLNATNTSVEKEEWDIASATRNLMDHVASAVDEVPLFRSIAERWRRKGKEIYTMADLFKCYYANISVVRIPIKGRYMLADEQISKLHQEIVQNCDASFRAKNDAHMLSNTDELNTYLQAGFDHFTSKEDEPFNFVEVSIRNNPIPRDFGDHILGLVAKVREVTGIRDIQYLFKKFSEIVASCIFIDCIRRHRPGKAVDWFDQYYAGSCAAALEHFCDKFWPCSFVSRKGKRCVNMKSSHGAKGHQSAEGKVISTGNYLSHFSPAKFSATWQTWIKEQLAALEAHQTDKTFVGSSSYAAYRSSDAMAYELHRQRLEIFYRSFSGFTASSFLSLTTCYSCLMEVPQHPLQCGHTLCIACIKAYGKPNDRNSVLMNHCPLHTSGMRNRQPWIVYFKPEYAGVRVLTLDGGGMRGIIELEVLRAIEQALGGRIPILAFFDLIVGTSTGGIIALGLGVKQWTLNQCVTEFVRLCDQAFTPREFSNIAGLTQATTIKHGSKFKTQPLRNALFSVFGSEQLFGGPRKAFNAYDVKVAVTATSGTGSRPVVLANYSRQEENEQNYKFEFPHYLEIWEAASATSAAPSFFKPFVSYRNLQTYLDGALYYNNPIKVANNERKLIWPDVADAHPDIILSVGTGMDAQEINEELGKASTKSSNVRSSKSKPTTRIGRWKEKLKIKPAKEKPRKLISKYFKVLVNRIDKILDAEREWKQFHNDVLDGKHTPDDVSRYVRINVDLGAAPPPLDEKDKLAEVQAKTTSILKGSEYCAMIEKIAHRLIASSFYFVKDERIDHDDKTNSWTCTGKIACRFEGNSSEFRHNIRSLGEFLRSQQSPKFQPFFSIKEELDHPELSRIEISQTTIDDMIARAVFSLNELVKIMVSSQLSATTIYLGLCESQRFEPNLYPISGFPRCLVTEDTVNASRLDKRAELIRQRRLNTLVVANDPKVAYPSDTSTLSSTDNPNSTLKDGKPGKDDRPGANEPALTEILKSDTSTSPPPIPATFTPTATWVRNSPSINQLRAKSHAPSEATLVDAEDAEKSGEPLESPDRGQDVMYESDDSDGPPLEGQDGE